MDLQKAMFFVLNAPGDTGGGGDEGAEGGRGGGGTSTGTSLPVCFNPKEFSLEREVAWSPAQTNADTAQQAFKGSQAFSLSMTLYFDTFEEKVSVRTKYMVALEKMTKMAEQASAGGDSKSGDAGEATKKQKPPSVLFIWGKFRFQGVIESLSQKYTMFLSDGTPVRAEADVTMVQTKDAADQPLSSDDGDGGMMPGTVASAALSGGAHALNAMPAGMQPDNPLSAIDQAKSALGGLVGGISENALAKTLEGAAAGMLGASLTGRSPFSGALVGGIAGASQNLFSNTLLGDTLSSGLGLGLLDLLPSNNPVDGGGSSTTPTGPRTKGTPPPPGGGRRPGGGGLTGGGSGSPGPGVPGPGPTSPTPPTTDPTPPPPGGGRRPGG